jgi:hypothetical protein
MNVKRYGFAVQAKLGRADNLAQSRRMFQAMIIGTGHQAICIALRAGTKKQIRSTTDLRTIVVANPAEFTTLRMHDARYSDTSTSFRYRAASSGGTGLM